MDTKRISGVSALGMVEKSPDQVVEDVHPQRGDGARQGVYNQRRGAATRRGDGIEHQGQAGHMVEVGMG